ncbi:uncharacterized protein ARMOST_05585 [Armillaria ostoyae]|uniref:Uncharacterized protein n=1 Tax=Armillaria ostoyae TaxID=47428 RepID=A0A284R0N4_ARMOS|nr:uncharacterized protein ARMOST_05585 [Armillaria ostoyae]
MSLLRILIFPLTIVLVSGFAISTVSSDLADLTSSCAKTNGGPFHILGPILGQFLCGIVTFFKLILSDPEGSHFLAVFLSFVAGLVTIVCLESARVANQAHRVIKYPTPALMMVNIVGGLVVFPLVLCPAFLLKSQNEHRLEPLVPTITAEGASVISETTPLIRALPLTDRHVLSVAEIYSIPLSVFLGFIVPSITLFLHPDNEVLIALWQLFPVYVAILRYISRAVLLRSVPHLCVNNVHVESDNVGLLYVYGAPSVVSLLTHLLYVWHALAPSSGVPNPQVHAALHVLVVDFWAIALTMLYWLWFEGGIRPATTALLASLIAGPGAGICVGWIMREEQKVQLLRYVSGAR